MSNTNFFTNQQGNTLLDKLVGLSESKYSYERFLAVAGFFRSTGYFALRKKLANIQEIKILVGINVDKIFSRQSSVEFAFSNAEMAKAIYTEDFIRDVREARYTAEVEKGILQMIDDVKSGRLELRICKNKNLHAKFYLCLPMAEDYGEHCCGSVIMGSSNLTDAGLGTKKESSQQYEMNVELKDYGNVNFCLEEFEKLWSEGVELTAEDIMSNARKTHLAEVTPYEIYLKVLMEIFGEQVEDDYMLEMPDTGGVKDLKYQRDAVVQAYRILKDHNGVLLADVVGLGKTFIATMIAKRFVEENGWRYTNILVVYPPALEQNWIEAFKTFGISQRAQFVTNGSLEKVINREDRYLDKGLFDLIIVDEAHGYRHDESTKYGFLQEICKEPRINCGAIKTKEKKVILLSATPLNNEPEDIENLLLLFQDAHQCTIPGTENLTNFFLPKKKLYARLMHDRVRNAISEEEFQEKIEEIYKDIREKIINKITVRRTRHNLMGDPEYLADLKAQNINFPDVRPPHSLKYTMQPELQKLFYDTYKALSYFSYFLQHWRENKGYLATKQRIPVDELPDCLCYARYRATGFLKDKFKVNRFARADQFAEVLANIYSVNMVKRLESSFAALRKSLSAQRTITEGMIKMLQENKVIISADLNVKKMQTDNLEIDQMIERALEKGLEQQDFLFETNQFDDDFLPYLQHDLRVIKDLEDQWNKVQVDPKFELFNEKMNSDFFHDNPSGKLVIFSESVDTLTYLKSKFDQMGRHDVLQVTAVNRKEKEQTVRENFDANYAVQNNGSKTLTSRAEYNILLSSEVLSEGINLHRANVIINYDTPWNATRLMQRIGRVNRIGSPHKTIHNFMFYPSDEGDKQIGLYKNALIKLQGFHSAFGEDAQVFSEEEIVKVFEFYNKNEKDETDEMLLYRRELNAIYEKNRKLYDHIKNLPEKCRTLREKPQKKDHTITFMKSQLKSEFYLINNEKVQTLDTLEALKIFRADVNEKGQDPSNNQMHYEHIERANKYWKTQHEQASNQYITVNNPTLTKPEMEAVKLINNLSRPTDDEQLKAECQTIINTIYKGTFNSLCRDVKKAFALEDAEKTKKALHELSIKCCREDSIPSGDSIEQSNKAHIVVSETFI